MDKNLTIQRYKYLVLGREGPYFVKEHFDSKNKYTAEDIIKMFEFLVDNIFFAGKVFQQIFGIPMGTNCAPLLADIFLYCPQPLCNRTFLWRCLCCHFAFLTFLLV